MKVFILEDDDERMRAFREALPDHEITHAPSVAVARTVFVPGSYDLLLLDHDLGDWGVNHDGRREIVDAHEEHGLAFLDFLFTCESGIDDDPWVIVHSWNQGAAREMIARLKDEGWKPYRQEFGKPLLDWLRTLR